MRVTRLEVVFLSFSNHQASSSQVPLFKAYIFRPYLYTYLKARPQHFRTPKHEVQTCFSIAASTNKLYGTPRSPATTVIYAGAWAVFERVIIEEGINGMKWSSQRRGTRTGTSQEPSPQGAFRPAPPHHTRCDQFGYTKSGFAFTESS